MTGNELRVGRLFRAETGRSFMVAFDRSLLAGPVPYARDAARALAGIVAGRPEAVLLSAGLLRQCAGLLADAEAPRAVVRIDYPLVKDFRVGDADRHRLVCDPAHAVRLGADAAVMCLIAGYDDGAAYADNLAAVAEAARRCQEVGLPLIVEAVLWGAQVEDPADAERLAEISRIAVELGADLVKTQYPGTPEGMRTIAAACPVPVLVLGGAALDDTGAVDAMTGGALAGGARGVIFGRNVWQRDDIGAISDSLRRLVHG